MLSCCRRIDNDTLLMRDMYPVTLLIGYQFALRWLNAHVFYIRQRSALAARVLRTLKSMPLNHPRFKEDIIEKVTSVLAPFSSSCPDPLKRALETCAPQYCMSPCSLPACVL